jgi:radical SAM protein with 4Fe4S-binding SPASM domain
MECAGTSFGSREYIRAFNEKTSRLRVPVSGSLDLTHQCNLRCVHCYLGEGAERAKRRSDEMSTDEIRRVIGEITDAGCLFLVITGGEPTTREDFPEIYRHAKEKGLLVTVFTNGTLITDKILGLFENLPPYAVEISLYGATPETYERITGVSGSYEKCVSGIRRLLARKINVRLKTILMTLNNHEFYDIENMAKEFGVRFHFDAAIFPCVSGVKAPLDLRVPPEEAIEKEFSDSERLRLWREYFERSRGETPSEMLYECGAGLNGFHIDPYGNLMPCLMTTRVKYDLLKGDFLTGWGGAVAGIREKSAGDVGCNECEKRFLCSFCPPFFELENGSERIRSEYLCAMGNYRLRALTNADIGGVKHGA